MITEYHPHSHIVASGFWVDIGSRHEKKGEQGICHFLEHMVFKGTRQRSAKDIAKSLEAVGGDLNACTAREYTCFHATSMSKDLELGLDVLSDLVSRARLAPIEIKREKSVVLQEISMANENLEEHIFDSYLELSLDTSLGHSILGSPQTIEKLNRTHLLDFYRNHYVGKHLIVSVAGQVQHSEVVKYISRQFRSLKGQKGPRRPLANRLGQKSSLDLKPIRKLLRRPSEQVHILVGVPAASFVSEFRFESYIFHALIGGGMTSRLYQSVRERKGLAYSVYSYLNSFVDCGQCLIYAGVDTKNLKRVVDLILEELRKIKKTGIRRSELEFFRNQVKGQIMIGSDDVENRMNSLAVNEMIFGRYRSVEDIMGEIDRISLNSMHEYISSIVDFRQLGILVMGEIEGANYESWLQSAGND